MPNKGNDEKNTINYKNVLSRRNKEGIFPFGPGCLKAVFREFAIH